MLKQHYSYTVYRRKDVAEKFDEDRFGGPVGELIGSWEENSVNVMLDASLEEAKILDVGAGTGRISICLAGRGAHVTGIDSSEEMLRKAEEKVRIAGVSVNFEVGDAHHLPFEDRSFDYVVSLRTLMHVVDWRRVLNEMCRVADKGVVFDFPPVMSIVLFAPLILRLKRVFTPETQVYRSFKVSSIVSVLSRNGFRVSGIRRHFVLPVFVHRKLGRRCLSENVEKFLALLGFRRLFGAPVVLKAIREEV